MAAKTKAVELAYLKRKIQAEQEMKTSAKAAATMVEEKVERKAPREMRLDTLFQERDKAHTSEENGPPLLIRNTYLSWRDDRTNWAKKHKVLRRKKSKLLQTRLFHHPAPFFQVSDLFMVFPEWHAAALRDALDRAPGAKMSAHFFYPGFVKVDKMARIFDN
jgi:hypothetical protein